MDLIKSMTGFGRAQKVFANKEITVEIRSVNHRYFEFSARVPRAYSYLEERLKSHLKTTISRGKIEVSVMISAVEGETTSVVRINHGLAKAYYDALKSLSEELQVRNDVTVSQMARFSDIFTVARAEEDEDEIWAMVQETVDEAVERFVSMRSLEGEKMEQDLLNRLLNIENWVGEVEVQSPKTLENYRARLKAKMDEILGDNTVDEARILAEAAIFADKIAVDEETVRLRSHIKQFRDILKANEPVGRKLDFLVQEFNRETNTIGSKAQDVNIAKIVVDIKSEIEKIREQIQNIE